MGNLSYNFNHQDFTCRCEKCRGKGEYRIHLGLVGALEMIAEHFKKRPKITLGYRCEPEIEKLGLSRKNLHIQGRAANFQIEESPLGEIFKFCETLPEVKGIGIYPQENLIHIDTRSGEKELWVKDFGKYLPLSPERRRKYVGD